MHVNFLLTSLFLAACGGSETAAPAAELAVPNPVGEVAKVAADAVGACKELDAYATTVEAMAAAYVKLDPKNPASTAEVSRLSMELMTRGQSLATQTWFASPGCQARYADIDARMKAVSARMQAKSAEFSAGAAGMQACVQKCSDGASEQVNTCMQGCMR